jgi:dihydropteroate synthase
VGHDDHGRAALTPLDRILVMGVLNTTPDSFSDGGHHLSLDAAVARVREMIAEGADVIDVGGESTRPGAAPIDPVEECRRVLPVLDAVVAETSGAGVRLSIDTRNEATARAAVAAGATMLNDVSASLWPVAADLGVAWVAMHMAGDPRTMQREPRYGDVVAEVRTFLADRAAEALAAGVTEVWVDPGIGFGKTTAHNLDLLAQLDTIAELGLPVLVGTSRKRFTGELLARSDAAGPGLSGLHAGSPVEPVAVLDRIDASLATATWAMARGASMVRVHDVRASVQAATVVSGGFGDR